MFNHTYFRNTIAQQEEVDKLASKSHVSSSTAKFSEEINLEEVHSMFTFLKNGPISASFCLFSSFSSYNFNNTNWKSIDVVLGIQTWGRRMVGADETTELPPLNVFLVTTFTFAIWRYAASSISGFLKQNIWKKYLLQKCGKFMGQPRPLFHLFSSFQIHITKFSTNRYV